jgi:hypothetical protein
MRLVANIQELIDHHARCDTRADVHYEAARVEHQISEAHPDAIPIEDIMPVVQSVDSQGKKCLSCGHPGFPVYRKSTATFEPVCRDCINAIRQVSVKHPVEAGRLCIDCDLKYDDYGFLIGASHRKLDIEDIPLLIDGVTVMAPGLKTLISLDRVTEDDDGHITIHDAPVTL